MEDVPDYSIEETFEEDVEMKRVEEIFNVLHLGGNDSYGNKCKKIQIVMIKMHVGGREKRQYFTSTKIQDTLWLLV